MKNILILFLCLAISTLKAQNLLPQQDKKGLFGYKKADSKRWAIKPTFQDAKKFGEMGLDSSLAFAQQKNLWGIIDLKGKWKIEPKYAKMNEYVEPIIIATSKDKEIDIINKYADIELYAITKVNYYKEGFFIVEKDNKKELYNQDFSNAVLEHCDDIYIYRVATYENSVIQFKRNNLYGFYKKNQTIDGYDSLQRTINCEFMGKKGNQYDYINYDSFKIVSLGSFDKAEVVDDSYIIVSRNNLKGLINKKGEIILNIEYQEIKEFSNNNISYLLLKKNNYFGIFGLEKSELSLPLKYSNISIQYDVYAPFCILEQNNKKHFFDPSQRKIIFENLDDIFTIKCNFNEYNFNVIVIKENNKYAIVKEGERTDFFDRIELEKGKFRVNGKVYDEITLYKGKNKFFYNFDDFSISQKSQSEKFQNQNTTNPDEFKMVEIIKNDEDEDLIYQDFEVYQDAKYPNGIDNLMQNIQKSLKYPEKAKINKTQGKVIIEFVVNKKGYAIKREVLKDVGDGCGIAALEAFTNNMQLAWEPARNQQGQLVNVRKIIKIRFKL